MKKNLYNLLTTLAALAVAFVTLVGMAAALCAPAWGVSMYSYDVANGFNILDFDTPLISSGYEWGTIVMAVLCWLQLLACVACLVLLLVFFFTKSARLYKTQLACSVTCLVFSFLYMVEGFVFSAISNGTYSGAVFYTLAYIPFIFVAMLFTGYVILWKVGGKKVVSAGDAASVAAQNGMYTYPPYTAQGNAPYMNGGAPYGQGGAPYGAPSAPVYGQNAPYAQPAPSSYAAPNAADAAAKVPVQPAQPAAPVPPAAPNAPYGAPAQEVPVYELNGGMTKILRVYNDRVSLQIIKNLRSFMTSNFFGGTKEIFYSDIIGVQYKEAGSVVAGYIQFETASGRAKDNFNNENSFTFSDAYLKNEVALQVVNFVRAKVREARAPQAAPVQVVQQVSAADELKKLKDLLDAGAITQEEFDEQKKKILGK